MINVNEGKQYIKNIEQRTRSLELEKAKLEQQREHSIKMMEETKQKITELGFTPETIDAGINKLSNDITVLRQKIDSVLTATGAGGNSAF